MASITDISYDLLMCIAEYLCAKDLVSLSQCNRFLYQLQWIDSLWKQYCIKQFSIGYNHPDQTFRELYVQCTQALKQNKRLPCHHLQYVDPYHQPAAAARAALSNNSTCRGCSMEGLENLFVCLSPNCNHQLLCDTHARHHARTMYSSSKAHTVYYKANMAEVYCQVCVDWMGGVESDPAEQYYASIITRNWANQLNQADAITEIKSARQFERQLRWKDTPQHIMNNPGGFCFISSSWMAEWEAFIEGWRTEPPTAVIDQTTLLSSVAQLNSVGANPFYLHSADNVMIVSNQTWNYLSSKYSVKGNRLTEDDLKPKELYRSISKRIEFWRRRAADIDLHSIKG